MKKQKIVAILSLWRNSASYIERSLAQFEALEKELKEHQIGCVYSFFENDSVDDTPQILLSWLRRRKGLLTS